MELEEGSPLIQNLFQKRDLLSSGDDKHRDIRPVLIILDGGMRGIHGAGSGIALRLAGLCEVFDAIVGISTGAAIGAFYLGDLNQGINGASIYWEDLPSFVRFMGNPIVDIDSLEVLFRWGEKKIDIRRVMDSRSQFLVGVTSYRDGTGALIDAKTAEPDMISAVMASMAMPGLYHRPVAVNGKLWVDGCLHPLPVRDVVSRFNPTDILILANRSLRQGRRRFPTLKERVCRPWLLRGIPPRLYQAVVTRYARWQSDLEFLTTLEGVNVGILWGTDNISLLTKNVRKLRHAAETTLQNTLRILGQPETDLQLP